MMRTTPDRSLARHQRVYRTLLIAYPRAFRHVYGTHMVQLFGDRLREDRARSGRRAGARVWLLTLLDLFKSAPVQRMEKKMSREAAFAMLFVLFLALREVSAVLGSRGPGVAVLFGLLIAAAIGLAASGSFGRKRARGNSPAGKLGIRQWWVVLAAVMGIIEVVAGVGQLVRDPSIDNGFALVVIGGGGLLVLAGAWFRTRSRSTGDWMIVVGILPFLVLFWLIIPPLLAILVMVMALIDSSGGREPQPQVM
jgi:hypothetical protein